ncbi:MAG TPA: hypothetical protein VGE57_02375 [Solimonas sp.]
MRAARLRWISLIGSALCLGASFAAPAQGPVLNCQAHDGQRWVSLGDGTYTACLNAIDARVTAYNAQGFKFGLWGGALLSADEFYFYQSDDQGANWTPAGLKSEVAAAGGQLMQPAPTTSAVLSAVEQTAQPAPMAAAPAPVAAEPVVISARPAGPSAPVWESGERRTCSLKINGQWQKLPELTIQECAQRLDDAPEPPNSNAAKFGYWSGTYLVANHKEVLRSKDSNQWETVIQRRGR